MILVCVILGAVISGSFYGIEGVLPGAVMGYLLERVWSMGKRLKGLESALAGLEKGPSRTFDASPPGAAPPEPVPAPQPAFSESIQESSPAGMEAGAPFSAAPFPPDLSAARPTETEAPAGFKQAGADFSARIGLFARDAFHRYVLGGSLLVKVGVIVLFFGVTFLLKYASERNLLPIELRLAGAAAGGIGLLAVGWRLRLQRPAYALALQGGGVGVLYLTVFAALRLYALVPPPLAFAILVGLAALSAVLAVLQDSGSLVVLGIAGGFVAPILTSTGSGSHVMLFSFYALLNGSILGIAWFKAWRPLNLLGFVFTFALGSTWGYRYYRPEYFATTEPFLILFFLFYVAVSILFALRQPPRLKGYVDGTLVFGTPLITFSLQALLVQGYAYGIALSALGFGLFYMGAAWLLFLKAPRGMRMLTEAFFAIGIVFGTLAIPLALDNRWTAVAWALEGCALLWIGIRQDRLLAKWSGILLQLGAGLAFLLDLRHSASGPPVLNGSYLSCLVVSGAGLFSACYIHLKRDSLSGWERTAGAALAAWGLLWWYGAGLSEISLHAPHGYDWACIVLFLALSSLIWDDLERRLDWPLMAYPALGLLPAMAAAAFAQASFTSHLLARGGFIAWPAAFAAYYLILYRHEKWTPAILRFLHAGGLWLLAWLAAWELSWAMDHWVRGADTWQIVSWGLTPAALILSVLAFGPKLAWPFRRHSTTYLTLGLGPVALAAWAWLLGANLVGTGDPRPLSYLPVLNPLDVTTSFILLCVSAWYRRLRQTLPEAIAPPAHRAAVAGLAGSLFFWMNTILARTIHFWGGVGFGLHTMFRSVLLQASLSIFWSFAALGVMVYATRRRARILWLTGAGLLAVVVVKLFAIDLSGTGTIERIVSFIGVGLLLLLVGYFSPVPPRAGKEDAAQ